MIVCLPDFGIFIPDSTCRTYPTMEKLLPHQRSEIANALESVSAQLRRDTSDVAGIRDNIRIIIAELIEKFGPVILQLLMDLVLSDKTKPATT